MTDISASPCPMATSVYGPCTGTRCYSAHWSEISRRTSGDRSWTV